MNTLEFLQRVLPTTGFYVTTVINADEKPKQGFFETVDQLAKAVVGLDGRGDNTYYAISSFKEKGSRKQENVRATKVIPLDVDCGPGKPFASWKEGAVAVGEFVKALSLPRPMIVASGNGLHVYWILEEALPPHEWKPLAEAMKAAALAQGFKVDAGLTANSALVLRPIGTRNPKNGNVVKLLVDAVPIAASTLSARLGVPGVPVPGAGSARSPSTSKLTQALAVTSDIPAAVGVVVAAKCQQIHWAVNHQADVPEPMWYGLLGIAAYCTDPEGVALAWSENHPLFNPDRTVAKMNHWRQSTTGPTTCSKFETDRPDGCKGCRFKDKIGTPARLGVQYQEVAPSTEAPDLSASEIPLPKPFKRTASGIKLTIDDSDIDICPFDIYPVSYGRDESLGYETVRYHWNRRHVGWTELTLRQAYLADGSREFPTALADQGIVLNGKKQTEYFQVMLRNYMDELRRQRTMTNLYATMGWKENYSQFVIGDTVYRRETDGTVSAESVSLASTANKLGHDLYTVSGDLQAWTDFTTVLDKAGLYAQMFALCVSFSAPLYDFTGLKGLTISLYGPTGGGKSLAQLWMQSVWGDPDKLHFAAKFTQNALFSRMGLYSHMPVTIDEVTMMPDKEVSDFLYWVSQGRDKARLNRNSEERDAKVFSLPVVVSTNKSMHGKMIASGLDTDAQMARLLEINVPQQPLFTNGSDGGRKIYSFVTNNTGHPGRAFIIKLLELGQDGIRAAIAEAMSTFKGNYRASFSGEERYWEQGIVLANLGGRLATEYGLIKFDYRKCIEWVLAQIGAIRRSVVEARLDAFDILSEYLNDNAASAITVIVTGTKSTVDHSRLPRGDIRIRFELYRKTIGDPFSAGVIMVDRVHFRKWLAMHNADYRAFMTQMELESVLATPRSEKYYLAKDSPIKLGQSYVVGLNLNHPRLYGILDRAEHDLESLTLGQMRLV